MALLQEWRDKAYSETANKGDLQRLWTDYFHRDTEKYATKQEQHDSLVDTLLSCGIPAESIKVVCDEDEMI